MTVYKRWVLLGALPFIVSGCGKQSAAAEQESAIVERAGDHFAICAAKRKVAAAYLKEQNESDYQRTNADAEIYCFNADADARRSMDADYIDNLTAVGP